MRRKRRRGLYNGFTIVEMLVSTALILIVITLAYNLYILAKDVWLYVYVEGKMHRDAMSGLERMIHGIDTDHKGIQEARDVVIPLPGAISARIEFVDQDNPSVSRVFYRDLDKIVYIDEDNNSSNLIDEDAQALVFNRPASRENLVGINLSLQKTVLGKSVIVNLTTMVEVRNM